MIAEEITKQRKMVTELEAWYKILEQKKSPHKAVWEDIAKYLLPELEIGLVHGFQVPADYRPGADCYDGSARNSHKLYSAGVFGYSMNPGSRWFEAELFKPGYTPSKREKMFLDDLEDALYFEFDNSNFYQVMYECISMAAGLGTVSLNVSDEGDKLYYETRHPVQIQLGGTKKAIDVEFYEKDVFLKDIVKEYGIEKLPISMKETYKSSPFEIHRVKIAVFERDDWQQGFVTADKKKFASVHYAPTMDRGTVLKISGFDSFPDDFWRWRVDFENVWASSLAGDALYDIRYLNAMGKSSLTQAQLISDPPWVIPESMKGKMRIKPRGMMYYRDHTMLPKPLSTGINYLPLDKELERRKNIIDNHYMVAFFTMLMQAQKTMTATEILEKKSEQVAVLSPMLIIFTDFLTRVIDRTHNKAKSRMPKVPPGMDIRKIKLRFIGPLPRARQKLQEQGILRTLQALGDRKSVV